MADCLIVPTCYEVYGLGVYEDLSCSLLSIVSAKAGVAEHYWSQSQDLLIPNPDNAVDLATQLQKWWCYKDHCSKLVSSLSQELRTYTWDNMAKSIFKYLQNSG